MRLGITWLGSKEWTCVEPRVESGFRQTFHVTVYEAGIDVFCSCVRCSPVGRSQGIVTGWGIMMPMIKRPYRETEVWSACIVGIVEYTRCQLYSWRSEKPVAVIKITPGWIVVGSAGVFQNVLRRAGPRILFKKEEISPKILRLNGWKAF